MTKTIAMQVLGPLALVVLTALPIAGHGATVYTIEMIVFADLDGDARYAENWKVDPGRPDTSRALPVSSGGAGVQPIGPSAYRLSGAWQALKRSGSFRPLRHVAWRQPGVSEKRAPEILIGQEGATPIFGTVRISRSRFLHVNLDLIFENEDGRYRLTTRRRMKSNELNYIDHPMFGVLVIATRPGN